MRHLKKGRKLSRKRDQRRALMKSLASSFFMLKRIKTTEAKAKEVRPFIEKFITKAKNQSVVNRRYLASFFRPKVTTRIIEIASELKERHGGYTRIIKIGRREKDGAKMAILELISKT